MTSPDTADTQALSVRCEWQTVLADAVTDPGELCRLLDLPTILAEEARWAARPFGLFVPRPYLDRIRPGDVEDPLLRQILPVKAESEASDGFVLDPLCEATASPVPGLLSKYQGRSLIVTTGQCGVHCRFCFRRHRRAPAAGMAPNLPEETVKCLNAERSLHEVILSGGDPLILGDADLADLAGQLASIPHLRRLRLHTRLPVVVPQRVTNDLIAWIGNTRLTVLIVLHINHPAEIDGAVARAIGRIVDAGIPLLSQSVLLRGVNDRGEVLAELFERLVDLRVMPYYLHQLDRVAGAAHFEVPEQRGIELIAELRARLPGYAVPHYVRDIPGNLNKKALA
jgi:EF-P beta-lysylation protein EpmB